MQGVAVLDFVKRYPFLVPEYKSQELLAIVVAKQSTTVHVLMN